ncbi:arrestin domain-containing protein 17-like [Patiria miniata]|uniref:Arrestin C-terminal-like domain-containing protein n=1 Tax=Patiria miniata TaxID=46514 RepID=A0A914AV13_PATMI|nr:arrestin domain-containing protein 17-like [Patiria miniata]
MGKLKRLQIAFDGDVVEYSPGDFIRGQAIMEIDPTKDGKGFEDINGIWMWFRGGAKTEFVPKNDSENVAASEECYFSDTLAVFGTGQHGRFPVDRTLLPGRHVFPFEFQIPNNQGLPQSFEGKSGHVRYFAKLVVSRNKTFYDKLNKEEKRFRLKRPTVDLSLKRRAEVAVHRDTTVATCCGCSDDVESIISLGLPRQGFLPGETIYVIGHVDNHTANENIRFRATFMQKITYKARRYQISTQKVTLSEQASQIGCPKGRITEFTLGPLLIPPDVPVSDLPGCNLIDIDYSVKCYTTGCKEVFPVMIGTVRSAAAHPPVISTAPPLNAMGDYGRWQTQTARENEYVNDCPPPSYEETVFHTLAIPRLISTNVQRIRLILISQSII